MTTLADVMAFIENAEQEEVQAISRANRERHRALRQREDFRGQMRAQVDAPVSLTGLSPKYLNGLTGVVATVGSRRCDVKLDETSTRFLRSKSRRFYVAPGVDEYVLQGVPFSAIGV